MKKKLQFIIGILLLFTFCSVYAQRKVLSTGKSAFIKAQSHVRYGTSPLATVAYANDSYTNENVSFPIPDGTPFTSLGSFAAPDFAASMCKGGDGNYYLLDITPSLYLFNPGSGTCTLIGSINGLNGDQPNGISYNPVDQSFYMVSDSAFYSFDINTLTATLIGYFTPSISGFMIDLCFDEYGTCYAYDVDAFVPKAYIIDINNAALTTLGYIGFTADFGQGMSYDFETHTIYLSAFNDDVFTGQLRTMDKTTGMTTLVYDWGDQIAAFAIDSHYDPPCNVEAADIPDPPTGAMNVSADGTTLSWDNGSGTTNVEVWFGTPGNINQVYNGSPSTSWQTGTLDYYTTYYWYIIDSNDTCGTESSTWTFTTEQSSNLLVEDFYPMSAQFWTGTTEGTTKTDGEINTIYPNVGWAVYDISGIPQYSQIEDVTFYGYVNDTYFPIWGATPMGDVNPVNAAAATINSQILASLDPSAAYIYSVESISFTTGWHNYQMGNGAITDLENAINAEQGWFAMGFVEPEFLTEFYINFDGWSQPNPPYIEISYVPVPVELTSFNAEVNDGVVVLNWQTATEMNNKGFEVERNQSSDVRDQSGWKKIGFVEGNGTSTESHSYAFTDKNLATGEYSYRLKQIDFDGNSEYSKVVKVNINVTTTFELHQNYPNPFNPSTFIQYSIPADQHVMLNIYNLLGQKLITLVDGMQKAGKHEVNFNASGISSGVYIYKLEAGTQSSFKKMILMK